MTPTEHLLLRRRVGEARRLGRDLLEYLDRHGHLLTAQRGGDIRTLALHQAADRLEKLPVADIIRRYGTRSHTALDAQAGIVALLRDWARQEVR